MYSRHPPPLNRATSTLPDSRPDFQALGLSQVDEQWGLYDGYDRQLEPVLRSRHKSGRHMPFMNVVPPGLDFSNLKVRALGCHAAEAQGINVL